jgi:hypothetical protein
VTVTDNSQVVTRRTTVWGGIGIALAAALSLATQTPLVLNSADDLVAYPVIWTLLMNIAIVTPLVLAAAVWALAFGVRDETGLVGDSRAGRTATATFIAATVVSGLLRLFLVIVPTRLTPNQVDVPSYLQLGLNAIALACLIVVAAVIVRRGELNRVLRWGIVTVAAWTILSLAMWVYPFILFASPIIFQAQTITFVLQIVLGIAIAFHGQSAALRRRAAIINEHW